MRLLTSLFTDIEDSTRLWEREHERMPTALASLENLSRKAVEDSGGQVVKSTGGGIYAVFDDCLCALRAAIDLQLSLVNPHATCGVRLKLKCGLHIGLVESRDGDFFGSDINRAARIMGVAHGGQVLLSEAITDRLKECLAEGVTLRDLGQVRLRGLSTPERVFQALHPLLRRDFPPLGALEATPHNLPPQKTSFLGRARELADVQALLEQVRLLTLLGTVGVGKSRLALQVAASLRDRFPDGAWHVELSAISGAEAFHHAVAQAFGIDEEGDNPILHALAEHVASRTLLLILDNCEHLIESCARLVAALLRDAPGLRVLVTSREPLRIDGEQTYLLPPLTLPQRGTQADGSEAVELFVERARQPQPEFALTDGNAAAVASICARLDGIPLALEFAAARVGALSVEEIDAGLAARFSLLAVDRRVAFPEQQTLGTRLDRSYERLDQGERLLFNRISVFAGGFDLDAAEQVCSAPPLSTDEVLDLLTALIDKSLIVNESRGQRSRYQQFEILRDFARDRACELPDGLADMAETSEHHARFFLALAKSAGPMLVGPEQAQWCEKLEQEHDNLRSAMVWALTRNKVPAFALELGAALHPFWLLYGYLEEGRNFLREALAMPDEHPVTDVRAAALHAAAHLASSESDLAAAKQPVTLSVEVRRESGTPHDVVMNPGSLSEDTKESDDQAAALARKNQARALLRNSDARSD